MISYASFNTAENVLPKIEDSRRAIIKLISRCQMVRPLLCTNTKFHGDGHCGDIVASSVFIVPTQTINNKIFFGCLLHYSSHQRLFFFFPLFFFLSFPLKILVKLKVSDSFSQIIHHSLFFPKIILLLNQNLRNFQKYLTSFDLESSLVSLQTQTHSQMKLADLKTEHFCSLSAFCCR
jgi:hypothetical protein